jgi:hypothetical protein
MLWGNLCHSNELDITDLAYASFLSGKTFLVIVDINADNGSAPLFGDTSCIKRAVHQKLAKSIITGLEKQGFNTTSNAAQAHDFALNLSIYARYTDKKSGSNWQCSALIALDINGPLPGTTNQKISLWSTTANRFIFDTSEHDSITQRLLLEYNDFVEYALGQQYLIAELLKQR